MKDQLFNIKNNKKTLENYKANNLNEKAYNL